MEVLEIKQYAQFKSELDTELSKTAESFVRIGYLLKVARDTDVLQESGYKTVAEFAQAEYGLSKDIVSRYIRINDKYSQNGYSEQLDERFKGFGYSKLAIMLTLPDSVADALVPQMSKSEIAAVQKEVKEEQQIPPLQVMMEEKKQEQQELGTDLQRFLHQYGYECRENVQALVNAAEGENFIEETLNIIAPSGVAMLSVRIPGRGRIMLSIKGKDEKLTLIDVRQNENSDWQWEELKKDIKEVYQEGREEDWERIYGESFKKEEEKQVEKEPEKKPKQEEQVKKESKQAAVQEQHDPKEGEKVDLYESVTKQTKSVSETPKSVSKEHKNVLKKGESVQKTKVAQVQREMDDEEVAVLSEFTYTAIKKYRDILIDLEEYTEKTIKKALHETTEGGKWVRFEAEGTVYFAEVDVVDSIEEVSVYTEDYKLEYTWSLSNVYAEIAAVINEDEDALKEEQIPGQAVIEDYPEVLPLQDDGYKTIALRCLPGETVYFIDSIEEARVVEGTVDRIEIEQDMIPEITVEVYEENEFMKSTFSQKEDWGKKIFKTREAAERCLEKE